MSACGVPDQAAVYGSREAALTPEIFERGLRMKVREHQQRQKFQQGGEPPAL